MVRQIQAPCEPRTKEELIHYKNENREKLITLWSFTVTLVPTRPRSFWAAASPSRPSSFCPEMIRLNELDIYQKKGYFNNWYAGWRTLPSKLRIVCFFNPPSISISSSPSCIPARAAGLPSIQDRTTCNIVKDDQ